MEFYSFKFYNSLKKCSIYFQKNPRDANNFDTEFTKEEPVLTPIPNDVVRCINQDEFAGFSFVNPKFGQERKVVY